MYDSVPTESVTWAGRVMAGLMAAFLAVPVAASGSLDSLGDTREAPIWLQDPWTGQNRLTAVAPPDQSLWNPGRVGDYQAALGQPSPPPLALLRIDHLGLAVPVYNGNDDITLDRGLGRIPGMARPGTDGNLGIAGHRDGFFRSLMAVAEGDRLLLETPHGDEHYEVSAISIVDKNDHDILGIDTAKMLTLVTCYPFYFVGQAPQRYIVYAVPLDPAP